MEAGDIMTVDTSTVGPEASIMDAARIMLDRRISGLPVIEQGGTLVGIVTERDLLRRPEIGTQPERPRWVELWLTAEELAEEYVRAHGRRVRDVMTPQVVSVGIDTPVSEVAALMQRHGIKRLPVVRDGKVIGIVSRADLLLALSRRIDKTPSSVVKDLSIRRGILQEIKEQRWAPRPAINVVVRDGVVELNGTVTNEHVRDAVRVAAENAPGVKRVADNLRTITSTATKT
ncbi:histidine kinase [Mesorhizobium huakuii]|uniref:CBS domain-containing protein n=1 Tax=Mesorhizobium huakuii TaxID=28104 RepID=UPI00235CEDAC|nr:CBS domain-containing protein [Mesorhizobium huakuii]GLQ79596.1 histidine kinase [Mesorhizobium huakuii]